MTDFQPVSMFTPAYNGDENIVDTGRRMMRTEREDDGLDNFRGEQMKRMRSSKRSRVQATWTMALWDYGLWEIYRKWER